VKLALIGISIKRPFESSPKPMPDATCQPKLPFSRVNPLE
jgi:hypothetical protein